MHPLQDESVHVCAAAGVKGRTISLCVTRFSVCASLHIVPVHVSAAAGVKRRTASLFALLESVAVHVCAAAGVKGRTVSLKLKRRKTNAPDPPKFMGHGDCDNMSRSVTLSRFTDSPAELASQGRALLKALKVNPTQIRGIGLNVSQSALGLLPRALGCRALETVVSWEQWRELVSTIVA